MSNNVPKLSVTEGLHKVLQKEDIDLIQATEFKEALCRTLTDFRNDKKYDEIFNKTNEVCVKHGIDTKEHSRTKGTKQRKLDDFVVESSSGYRRSLETAVNFKTEIFYPCLDRMLSELNNRFSTINSRLLKGMQACNPSSDNFLKYEDLLLLPVFYLIILNSAEIEVARNHLLKRMGLNSASGAKTKQSIISLYKLLRSVMFPTLKQLLQVVLTIPISSCSCERSFSALRRLHTWLRGTTTEDRLDDLALMSIEKSVLDMTSDEAIVDHFAAKDTRRPPLISSKR